jgi:divalent metal cation (Fe/Co/Zn/Cd) transporter
VAIVLFSVGGLYALYEGWHKVADPHELSSPLVAVIVLVVALGLEGYALRTAAREANRVRGDRSWWQFVRHARAPELPVILLEDTGALIGLVLALFGVGLSVLTGNGIFDGIATLGIGVLLVAIAVVLAVEIKSLLVGESATPAQTAAIHSALLAQPGVDRVIHLRTLHLGPEELLVAAKSASKPATTRPTSRRPSTPPRPGSAKRRQPRRSSIWSRISIAQRSRPDNRASAARPRPAVVTGCDIVEGCDH